MSGGMNLGLFDIMGPVMIGPSSSHTAGAARLGRLVRQLIGGDIHKVDMYLHGSFAATYRGHGTDKALLAGILDMLPSDERLRDSFRLAQEAGIEYAFIPVDLGEDYHPNTVKFVVTSSSGITHTVIGASIGGGQVLIQEIDSLKVRFTGERPIIICRHEDHPGVIAGITTLLYEARINIGNMSVNRDPNSRNSEHPTAQMYIEIDSIPPEGLEYHIRCIRGILDAMILLPIRE